MPTSVTVTAPPAYTVTVTNDQAATVTTPAPVPTTVTVTDPPSNVVTIANLGPQGPAGVSTFETVHTYAIGGTLNTTDFIPPMFFFKMSGQTSTLKKIVHRINSGTSATVKLQRNAADITGYTGVNVTTTRAATLQDQVLADGDTINLVITAVSGAPSDMTVTLVIEHDL